MALVATNSTAEPDAIIVSEADITFAELAATAMADGESVQVGRTPRQAELLQPQALDHGGHSGDVVDGMGPDALGGGALELDDKQGLVGYHARRDVEGGFGCLLVAPMSGGVVGVREIRRRTLGRQLAGGGIFDKDRGEWRIQD